MAIVACIYYIEIPQYNTVADLGGAYGAEAQSLSKLSLLINLCQLLANCLCSYI